MKRQSTSIAITSGKGGVGKSIVAVNLAETLLQQGHSVALVDADFGQGACSVLMNETPSASVLDCIRRIIPIDDALHTTVSGLTLVQAVAEPGITQSESHRLYAQLDALLDDLRQTHTFVLVDAPAGTDGPVRWALDRADLGLLVLVGEPTAVADAYRLLKLIWQADPAFPMGSVVNFADDEADAKGIAARFATVTAHFTGQETMYLGWVPFSLHLRQSVRAQRPAVYTPGPVAEAFETIARTLVQGRQPALVPIQI